MQFTQFQLGGSDTRNLTSYLRPDSYGSYEESVPLSELS